MNMKLVTLSMLTALSISAANAATINVNFSGLASGTAVTTQFSGLTFSLVGGPGPTTAPTTTGYGYLTNSVYAGSYPTANILDVIFNGAVANNISFIFDPAGYCATNCSSVPGIQRGRTYYQAFDVYGKLLETGELGALTGGGKGTFSVKTAGVHQLQFNNGTSGKDSWWFGLESLTATTADIADVPAPATMALLGFGVLGFALSRRRKSS